MPWGSALSFWVTLYLDFASEVGANELDNTKHSMLHRACCEWEYEIRHFILQEERHKISSGISRITFFISRMLFSCMWRIAYTFLKELKCQEKVECNTLGAKISCKRFVFEFSLKVLCSCLWTTIFPVGRKNFHHTIKYFGKSLQVWPCTINILKILCIK